MERWVLYIASDRNSRKAYDAGSEACVKIVQTGGLADSVDVQDCDVLRRSKVTFPEWLVGTPTLYDGEERRAYLGIDAVVKLACIRPAPRAAGHGDGVESMQRGVVERRDDQRDADAGWPSRKKSVNVQLPPRDAQDGDAEETPDAFAPVADADDGLMYSDARKITSNDVEQYLQAREKQMRSGQ